MKRGNLTCKEEKKRIRKWGVTYGRSDCHSLLKWIRERFHWRITGERLEQMKKIYVGKKEEEIFYAYYGKVIRMLWLAIAACLFFCVISCLIPEESHLLNGNLLKKDGALGEEKSISLVAEGTGKKREVTIAVPKETYTERELEQEFQKAEKYVEEHYLGENVSPRQIDKPLNLVREIPNSAITVEWKLAGDDIVQADGRVKNDELEEKAETEISVVFTYGKQKKSITKKLTVMPCYKSKEILFWEEWQKQLALKKQEGQSEAYLELPSLVQGERIVYQEKPSSHFPILLALLFVLPLISILLMEENLRKKLVKREEELKLDYPEFVEQFVLLLGAGLNVKETWHRIVSDYEKKRPRQTQYVYEEMLVSVREMENGMSEARAYELFGKRTGLLQYMKFCTLIVQNLRKGSEDLLKLLDYEVADAFRERKENAKTLGEKASTKLLLPMMIMLVIVFALILYAAFYNM